MTLVCNIRTYKSDIDRAGPEIPMNRRASQTAA
jgi:hypothetical protein